MRWRQSVLMVVVATAGPWWERQQMAEGWSLGSPHSKKIVQKSKRAETAVLARPPRRPGGGDMTPLLEKEEEKEVRVKVAVAELERPTQTEAEVSAVSVGPTQRQIVVLGATGRVGRRVVRRLLSLDTDMTIVAFVRSFERAIDVLLSPVDADDDGENMMDRVEVVDGDVSRQKYDSMFATVRRKQKGPQLRLVVTDLVQDDRAVYNHGSAPIPPFRLDWSDRAAANSDSGNDQKEDDQQNEEEEDDDGEELEVNYEEQDDSQLTPASSLAENNDTDTSLKYPNSYDDDLNSDDWLRVEASEALREAIGSCTAIVSCLGTVRRTNLWTDVLRSPWGTRMFFSRSVSTWCDDYRHPHYVHYKTTQRILQMAEAEQERRNAAAEAAAAEQAGRPKGRNVTLPEKIKIIRISDLSVARPPWSPTAIVTNLLRSMVFRYQEMAEIFLQRSRLVDTIILRPGDLTDVPRNVNTTSLQVDASGTLPPPAMVGRDDVAELAVLAALTPLDAGVVVSRARAAAAARSRPLPATHQTWAIRWAGEELRQGTRQDGCRDARTSVQKLRRNQERQSRLSLTQRRWTPPRPRRVLKAYGACAALTLYGLLWMLLLRHVLPWGWMAARLPRLFGR